jgi:hypothetical protein
MEQGFEAAKAYFVHPAMTQGFEASKEVLSWPFQLAEDQDFEAAKNYFFSWQWHRDLVLQKTFQAGSFNHRWYRG